MEGSVLVFMLVLDWNPRKPCKIHSSIRPHIPSPFLGLHPRTDGGVNPQNDVCKLR